MRGFSACCSTLLSCGMGPGPGWQGGKKPYHPTNIDACSALGVVLLFSPPLLCPTRISEKSTFSYFLCLIKQNQRKWLAFARGAALLLFWVCCERLFCQQAANRAAPKASAVCYPRPAVPLNLWPFACIRAFIWNGVSFSFFTLMGDFTSNLFVFFMHYIEMSHNRKPNLRRALKVEKIVHKS